MKRKLIEVALPLEAINRESAREKSIRHGHPSTLHLWWARRPLAACRAVLFAQLVDDPSAHPDKFPNDEDQALERKRLFDLIERMVVWENAADSQLLREVHAEIAKCFDGEPPAVTDPFAGGGSIPLEAHRLGLETYASDLNPVAVLINRALLEIPPAWANRPPVFPGSAEARLGDWERATGLAEDVRRYGDWIRTEAIARIGHLYPTVTTPKGGTAPAIGWLWARTVLCANPACGATMPLVRSFWVSKKKDRPTWLRAIPREKHVDFEVVVGSPGPSIDGTVGRSGATCLVCATPVPLAYIRSEGQAGRIGQQLLAVIAEGQRQRVYSAASADQVDAAAVKRPLDVPDAELATHPQYMAAPRYGMREVADLFTNRQLVALTTLSDLVQEAHSRIASDATRRDSRDAHAYADAVCTYLGLAVGRSSDYNSSICSWHSGRDTIRNTFGRQAIPMVWDFAEANPLGRSTGNWGGQIAWISSVLDTLPATQASVHVGQADARSATVQGCVSTDPPYYDNVPYADLADFFYAWLRRALRTVHGDLLSTLRTPKLDELVADHQRFGGRAAAERYFEDGFVETFSNIRKSARPDVPVTIYYAFKQAEAHEGSIASTGWEKMLSALIESGLTVTATWPLRSELANRMRSLDSNALASSIVLSCRPRETSAESTTRRGFLQALKEELPSALKKMQQGSLAPVDLAQAAIGPGMAVFTRYRRIVEADGSAMSVRTALALINQVLDEALSEQEGDFSADTRFCVKWFAQFGWDEQLYGVAESLSKAVATSVDGLVRGGVFWARAGKARLVGLDELSEAWDPLADERLSEWEVVVRLARALDREGIDEAVRLMTLAGQRIDLDTTKELAYLLYSVCEKRGWTASAAIFNGLGTSWSDLTAAGNSIATTPDAQGELDYDTDEEA